MIDISPLAHAARPLLAMRPAFPRPTCVLDRCARDWCGCEGHGASQAGAPLLASRRTVRSLAAALAQMVTLDHLEFLEVLGRGASSYVQLVRNKTTGECVALKVVQCFASVRAPPAQLAVAVRQVINMFEKAKRDQLIREIRALHDADCPWCGGEGGGAARCVPACSCARALGSLIGFYGAFYREGSINIALEYMDRGSLDQVLLSRRTAACHPSLVASPTAQQGTLPEFVLANITYQILFALAYLKHENRVHRVRARARFSRRCTRGLAALIANGARARVHRTSNRRTFSSTARAA